MIMVTKWKQNNKFQKLYLPNSPTFVSYRDIDLLFILL